MHCSSGTTHLLNHGKKNTYMMLGSLKTGNENKINFIVAFLKKKLPDRNYLCVINLCWLNKSYRHLAAEQSHFQFLKKRGVTKRMDVISICAINTGTEWLSFPFAGCRNRAKENTLYSTCSFLSGSSIDLEKDGWEKSVSSEWTVGRLETTGGS